MSKAHNTVPPCPHGRGLGCRICYAQHYAASLHMAGRGRHTVIDVESGEILLAGATTSEFDRWYDHHDDYRQPRDETEIPPELREAYRLRAPHTHYLVRN